MSSARPTGTLQLKVLLATLNPSIGLDEKDEGFLWADVSQEAQEKRHVASDGTASETTAERVAAVNADHADAIETLGGVDIPREDRTMLNRDILGRVGEDKL